MIGKTRTYWASPKTTYSLQLLDLFADVYGQFYKRRRRNQETARQARFLLMTSGHLGDALTLSYVFPLLREEYPDCLIDVVAGAWCDPVFVGNPYIRRLIHLNHARSNRSSTTRLAKWKEYIRTTQRAVSQLSSETYTASIDVRFAHSPMHFLLPFIHVNRSIGFGSRGLGGLLDEELFPPEGEFHHLIGVLKLLKAIGVDKDLSHIRPYFHFPDTARQTLEAKLKLPQHEGRPIVLLCPESGDVSRFLSHTFWRNLTGHVLATTDCVVIGCGQLTQTDQLMADIALDNQSYQGRIYNTVGTLTLAELAALSERASIALTLESLPAHLCSIFCPAISYFYRGTGLLFFPLSNHPAMVFHDNVYSRNHTLDRLNFTSTYVADFDEHVQRQSLEWIRNVLSGSKYAG